MKLIIQIPCLNEAETLEIALNDLPKHIDGIDTIEYLIINDGSSDNTVEVAKNWVIMVLVTATIMIVAGIDNTNAITIALSCVSNVGPTLGTQIGPVMSWSMLPDYIKWILCPLMLMGRLEIMTVLVLFTRSYWKEN